MVSALLPAAGRGQRFGKPYNKIFEILGSKPILAHTIEVFENLNEINEIVLVTGKQDIEAAGNIVSRFGFHKVKAIIEGGMQRQDSVRIGLEHINSEIVAIHDAARPLISIDTIKASIAVADKYGAAIATVPVIDTIKSVSNAFVSGTVDRNSLVAVQTPQTFKTDIIKNAHLKALEANFYSTDDAALVEWCGLPVAIVDGSYNNIKITTPADMNFASAKLASNQSIEESPLNDIRTGIGYDVHRLVEDRNPVLGGVEIDYKYGLLGHSDADVLLPALCDALLGAAGLGDIGKHFPDNDPQYKGISSIKLLENVMEYLKNDNWKLVNADIVVICQKPKIAAYITQMRTKIAKELNSDPSLINIKGTTTEELGFEGRGEGIASMATVLISR